MLNIKLPFWMDKGEFAKLRSLFLKWWSLALKLAQFPLTLFDEETAPEWLVNLLAYQRDIERFKSEPLALFRKRVKYAFVNAEEAGSVKGFKNIFERLGIGQVEIRERIEGLDFDIVHLKLTDSQLSEHDQLIYEVLRKYGRTCRRYSFLTENTIEIYLHYGEFGHDYYFDEIKIEVNR